MSFEISKTSRSLTALLSFWRPTRQAFPKPRFWILPSAFSSSPRPPVFFAPRWRKPESGARHLGLCRCLGCSIIRGYGEIHGDIGIYRDM